MSLLELALSMFVCFLIVVPSMYFAAILRELGFSMLSSTLLTIAGAGMGFLLAYWFTFLYTSLQLLADS